MSGHAAPSIVAGSSIIPGGTETVLVVEDDPAVRRLIQELLGRRGYTVLTAGTGAEAIRACGENAVDLLLVDLNLPDIGGRELAQQLSDAHENLRLLYISGQGERAIEDLGIFPHGRLFLPKPFTPYELAWRVREVLDAAAT